MIFSTLQAGFKDLTVTKITEIITTALPSLIWTAVIYKSRVYIRGAYKTKEDRTQGEAETSILRLQKSLPDMPHVLTLPVRWQDEIIGYIIAAKSKGDTFTKMGIEFLNGVCHIVEAIYEYEQMKEEKIFLLKQKYGHSRHRSIPISFTIR